MSKAGVSRKILIVDDQPFNLDLLEQELSEQGYTIERAGDGEECLRKVETFVPDVILLDIMMPKLDGIQVVKRLKEDERYKKYRTIPIILLTAKGSPGDKVKGLDAGAEDYIPKPFERIELLARVRSMVRIKEMHDSLEELNRTLEEKVQHQVNEIASLLEEAKLSEMVHRIGDIGHDVKNMLTPVTLGVQILQEELDNLFQSVPPESASAVSSCERCKLVLHTIRNSGRRILDRVKQIADCVKGLSSPPQFAPCSIQDVARCVLEDLTMLAKEVGVLLLTEGLEEMPRIMADERRLYNAFYNLVNNAISEVPRGGTVTVRGGTEHESQCVLVSVIDTGRGMPAEVRDKLFTKEAISTKVGGTGLGTKIVKDAVDAHSGQVTVESKEGVGTTFHIRLPITLSSTKNY
jgi:signal transduction histidine kinase